MKNALLSMFILMMANCAEDEISVLRDEQGPDAGDSTESVVEAVDLSGLVPPICGPGSGDPRCAGTWPSTSSCGCRPKGMPQPACCTLGPDDHLKM
jgi:hypothetical protein